MYIIIVLQFSRNASPGCVAAAKASRCCHGRLLALNFLSSRLGRDICARRGSKGVTDEGELIAALAHSSSRTDACL